MRTTAKIDYRSKADIAELIQKRAKSYTPEWNMNTENPDIACALALAYADMFSGTLKQFNNVPLKNKIAFYNMANASLLPSVPSTGYVSFSLASSDVENTEVPLGTVVSAPNDDDNVVSFETCDDILVSSSLIEKIFCADDSADYIGEYNLSEAETSLFDKTGENLQKHTMRISHPYIFDVKKSTKIRLGFYQRGNIPVSATYLKSLADRQSARVEYYGGETAGFIEFDRVYEDNGTLVLVKSENQPVIVRDENGELTIQITALNIDKFEDFAFLRAEASASSSEIGCDVVTDGNTEYEVKRFFPFGERFQLFNEVYFGCNEVLNKRGATVTMSFDLSFVKVPIENQMPDDDVNWKWVANKGDFKKSREYDISITEVIWEYFNGVGWSRLFTDNSYGRAFSVEQGVTELYKAITFVCPEDIETVFVGATENYFIRARILKAENLYKLRGQFITPQVANVSFEYGYNGNLRRLTSIVSENNLEVQSFDPTEQTEQNGYKPFYCTGVSKSTIYLGFSSAIEKGPYRILWDLHEHINAEQPKLSWEYLSERGWRSVNMADETAGFTKAGLTVLLDNPDFKRQRLFDNELFWVRVIDEDDYYKASGAYFPQVKGFYENTVRAVNIDSHKEEFFSINVYTENASFTLSESSIIEFELFVNEADTITDNESRLLQEQGLAEVVCDEAGMVTAIWVKWKEVSAFISEDAVSRCYTIDKSSGVFTFGNGRSGRIPAVSDIENIRAVYTTGGGERSNANAGEINHLERSIGFVTGVTNPLKFSGGCNTETLSDAMERSAVMMRTQGKAVTLRDYEKLAMYAVRTVDKIKCFSGYNAFGNRENGAVTLVVIRSDNSEFSKIQESIKSYLTPRIAGGIVSADKLYITEPEFVRVNVRIDISVNSINDVFSVKKSVENQLENFLNTLNGGFDGSGWRVGQLPNEQQIRSCIMRLKDVVYIKNIYLTMYLDGSNGLTEIDAQTAQNHKYLLTKNGTHEIVISLA